MGKIPGWDLIDTSRDKVMGRPRFIRKWHGKDIFGNVRELKIFREWDRYTPYYKRFIRLQLDQREMNGFVIKFGPNQQEKAISAAIEWMRRNPIAPPRAMRIRGRVLTGKFKTTQKLARDYIRYAGTGKIPSPIEGEDTWRE